MGWAFRGLSAFHGRATTFLAEGRRRNEHLIFLADDPDPGHWPADLLRRGILRVASIAEVYGPHRLVDAKEQRAVFTSVLTDALQSGFAGIRVAADNTSLIATPERLEAWCAWEAEADRFIVDNPVTGLCAFDVTRADPGALREITGLHTTMVASS